MFYVWPVSEGERGIQWWSRGQFGKCMEFFSVLKIACHKNSARGCKTLQQCLSVHWYPGYSLVAW